MAVLFGGLALMVTAMHGRVVPDAWPMILMVPFFLYLRALVVSQGAIAPGPLIVSGIVAVASWIAARAEQKKSPTVGSEPAVQNLVAARSPSGDTLVVQAQHGPAAGEEVASVRHS